MKTITRRVLVYIGVCFCLITAGCVRPASESNWLPSETPSEEGTQTPAQELAGTVTKTIQGIVPQVTSTPFILPESLPHSVKGYELYCWQKDDDWYFTLFTGTNRSKSFDEIIAPENQIDPSGLIKITVSGLEKVKEILSLLPAGEDIVWGGMDLSGQVPSGTVYLTFPPQSMMDEIQSACREYKLTLKILKE